MGEDEWAEPAFTKAQLKVLGQAADILDDHGREILAEQLHYVVEANQ